MNLKGDKTAWLIVIFQLHVLHVCSDCVGGVLNLASLEVLPGKCDEGRWEKKMEDMGKGEIITMNYGN